MTACVAASMISNYPGMNDHFWKPGLYRDLKMKRKRVSDICKVEVARNRSDDFSKDFDTLSEADSAYASDFGIDDAPDAKIPKLNNQRNFILSKLRSSPTGLMEAWKSPKASTNLYMPCFSLQPGCMLQPQQVLTMNSESGSKCPTSIQFIPVMSSNQTSPMTTSVMTCPTVSSASRGPMFVATPPLPPLLSTSQKLKSHLSSLSHMSDVSDLRSADSVSSHCSKSKTNEKPIKEQDFISHYTNGQFTYNGHLVDNPHNHGSSSHFEKKEKDDGGVIMVCAICQDRATGLHYGIITCEGCKGFFKRTVQNKRIYSCVANGDCEINRAQRNRCQFCRFKKCLEKGMVLAAVREDRMPGGRNSGAVYNLYKVKYKKHKKKELGLKKICYQSQMSSNSIISSSSCYSNLRNADSFDHDAWVPSGITQCSDSLAGSSLLNMTAPRHVPYQPLPEICNGQQEWIHSVSECGSTHNRLPAPLPSHNHNYPTIVTSQPDTKMEECKRLILELVEKDTLLGIAKSYGFDQLIANQDSVAQALCKIGDDIVIKLVHWIRNLPFYSEIPLKLQSQILTKKWHELLLLIMTAFGALNSEKNSTSLPLFADLFQQNISKIWCYLSKTFGNSLSTSQLNKEVGPVTEKVTHIMIKFLSLRLSRQEFVCLQVILLMSPSDDIEDESSAMESIQERYMKALQLYSRTQYSSQPYRFGELLLLLRQIHEASTMLLDSKMIYIPFLLNT